MPRHPNAHGKDQFAKLSPDVTRDIASDAAGQEATGDPGSKKNFGQLLPEWTGHVESDDGRDTSPR